jgi:hypothetical protein
MREFPFVQRLVWTKAKFSQALGINRRFIFPSPVLQRADLADHAPSTRTEYYQSAFAYGVRNKPPSPLRARRRQSLVRHRSERKSLLIEAISPARPTMTVVARKKRATPQKKKCSRINDETRWLVANVVLNKPHVRRKAHYSGSCHSGKGEIGETGEAKPTPTADVLLTMT